MYRGTQHPAEPALPGTLVSGHHLPSSPPPSQPRQLRVALPGPVRLVNWSFPCPFEGELDNGNGELSNYSHQTSPSHREYPSRRRRTVRLTWTILQQTCQPHRRTSLRLPSKQLSPLASHPRHKMVSLPEHYDTSTKPICEEDQQDLKLTMMPSNSRPPSR